MVVDFGFDYNCDYIHPNSVTTDYSVEVYHGTKMVAGGRGGG